MDLVEFEWEVHEKTYAWVEASQYSEVGAGTASSEYPFPRGSPYLITSYLRDDWPPMATPTRESRKNMP